MLPTDTGLLYVCKGGEVRRTALVAGKEIGVWAASTSPRGTIIAVGTDGFIARSNDGGESFERIKVAGPAIDSLLNVESNASGRFVASGTAGVILTSDNDGRTFKRVKNDFDDRWFCGVARFGDRVLVGGDAAVVLAVG